MTAGALWILAGLGVTIAAVDRRRARAFDDLALLVVFALGVLGLACVAVEAPHLFDQWLRGAPWVHRSTFCFFLSAALLNVAVAVRVFRDTTDLVRRLLSAGVALGLGLLLFFVAGGEISWARHIFFAESFGYLVEHNFRRGCDLYSGLTGEHPSGPFGDTGWLAVLLALAYGVAFPLFARLSLRGRRFVPRHLVPPRWVRPCFFLVVAVALTGPLHLTGEAAELALAIAFVLDGLSRLQTDRVGRPLVARTSAMAVTVAPLLLGVVAPALLHRVLDRPTDETRAQAWAELQILAEDIREQSRRGNVRFKRRSRFHKRLFTAVRDGYLRFGTESRFLDRHLSPAEVPAGDARRDRRGYFLDPWNNPYWIFAHRASKSVVLYSFGANERRDTDVRGQPFQVGGDDTAVILSLTSSDGPLSLAERW